MYIVNTIKWGPNVRMYNNRNCMGKILITSFTYFSKTK